MSGAASITNASSSRPRAAASLSSITTTTAGWISISPMATGWMHTGPPGKAPTTHLYKNNRDGTFTDVTEKSGLGRTAGKPASASATTTTMAGTTCSATFWGHNILFHNNGDGTFTDVTQQGRPLSGERPLGHGLHVPRLRPRRPSRSFRLQLRQARSRQIRRPQ